MSHNSSPTTIEDWTRSDRYHNSFLIKPDPALDFALKNSSDNRLPEIAVTKAQGKFLNLLARSVGAKNILEVGTLGGYSTIWFAKAVPADGKVITLEVNEKHAKVAADNVKNAGLADKVDIKLGPAVETLKAWDADITFDLVFIDADKPSNTAYFEYAKKLVRKGGVIIVDNVGRGGKVANPAVSDANIEGVRSLLKYIQNDFEVDATTVTTIGEKGYDGFLYAIRL